MIQARKPIVPTVKTPISTKELLVRLQALADELSAVDQDAIDGNAAEQDAYRVVLIDLSNKKLLAHNNIGVQLLTCCALADVLRISAPNAPFTAPQLTEIFRAFFRQLRRLGNTNNAWFAQQCALLQKLAEVRAVVLITDLPDASELVDELFEIFYDLAPVFPSRLELLACDILLESIAEVEIIPTTVLRRILEQFLVKDAGVVASNISHPALVFSKRVCEQNADRMARQTAQYFLEILYEGEKGKEEEEQRRLGKEEKRKEDQKKHSGKGKQSKHTETDTRSRRNTDTTSAVLHIHELSVAMWRSVPELLSAVMGLLEDELNASSVSIRALAVRTIGRMVPYADGDLLSVSFVVTHRGTWNAWLRKSTDIHADVRTAWAEQFASIVESSITSDVAALIVNCLHKCMLDTDERVRYGACCALARVRFATFTAKVCNAGIISTLGALARERSPKIRSRAVGILGNLYAEYAQATTVDFGSRGERESAELTSMLRRDVPSHVMLLVYINDVNVNAVVDVCVFEQLLPWNEPKLRVRAERIAALYAGLDARGKEAFFAISRRQQQLAKVVQKYVEETERDEHERRPDHLAKIINWLCVAYPTHIPAALCLQRLACLGKSRFTYLLKVCTSPESDYNTVRNCIREFQNKIADPKNYRVEDAPPVTAADMGETFRLLLYRASLVIYNKSNVAELIRLGREKGEQSEEEQESKEGEKERELEGEQEQRSQEGEQRESSQGMDIESLTVASNEAAGPLSEPSAANEILDDVSTVVPDVFKFHLRSLTEMIVGSGSGTRSLQLRTMYHFVKKYPEYFPLGYEFSEALKDTATGGTPREAKYAVKMLGLRAHREVVCSAIVGAVYPPDLTSERFPTHLSLLAELFLVDPLLVQDHAEDLTSLLIREVFLQNRTSGECNDEWIDDDALDLHCTHHRTLYEKLLGLRLLVNRLRGEKGAGVSDGTGDEKDGNEIASAGEGDKNDNISSDISAQAAPVIKLLMSFIGNSGEIISKLLPSWPTPEPYKRRLRLAAGLYLLKLAKFPVYSQMISPTTLNRMTFLLTDPCEEVRLHFLVALQRKLLAEVVSERFNAVLFFAAMEPSVELKHNASMWIQSLFRRQVAKGTTKFERALVRLIHMLAHHQQYEQLLKDTDTPQGKLGVAALQFASRFLCFYVSIIANADNVSLLYYLASRVKQYRDAAVDATMYEARPLPLEVHQLYRVAELAQLIIKEYADHKMWTMQTWQGKIKLPTDLYVPMGSILEAQGVVSHVFIPTDVQGELRASITKTLLRGKRVRTERPVRTERTHKAKKVSEKKRRLKVRKEAVSEPRRSSRATKKVEYRESDSGSESESESEIGSDSGSEYE